jgi:hypothetical protein
MPTDLPNVWYFADLIQYNKDPVASVVAIAGFFSITTEQYEIEAKRAATYAPFFKLKSYCNLICQICNNWSYGISTYIPDSWTCASLIRYNTARLANVSAIPGMPG